MVGALLMPTGAIVAFFSQRLGTVLYASGVLCYTVHVACHIRDKHPADQHPQYKSSMHGLRVNVWISLILLVLSAVCMCMQTWDYMHGTWLFPYAHRNVWVALCLAGAVAQLYANWRLEHLRRKLSVLLLPIMALSLTTACAEGYMVKGESNIHALEGEMLYLKVYEGEKLKNIDSARVTHGRFTFQGHIDSTVLVNLFVDDVSLMPMVLENTQLQMKLNEMEQIVKGSELNDTLCCFIHQKSQLDNMLAELPYKEGRMVMDGMDFDEVAEQLNMEYAQLMEKSNRLVVDFIKRHYHNVLGPGIFMIMTSGMPYPVLTPTVEEIMITAPEGFRQNPYVRDFMIKAEGNSEKLGE